MKTTRLITYWDADQLMTVIDMLDELRQALMGTYHGEIADYQKQRRLEQKRLNDNLDVFNDDIGF